MIQATTRADRRAGHRLRILGAAMLVVPNVVAGCSTPGAATAPPGVASASPSVVSGPTTTPSPIASQAVATATPPAEPGPIGTIRDPNLSFLLPTGWKEMTIANFRTIVEASVTGSSQEMKRAIDALVRDIDDGSVRLVAAGTAGFGGWSATMTVQVNKGDLSLGAAVTRIQERSDGLVVRTSRDQGAVTLEIGEAVRSVSTYAVEPSSGTGSVPSRVVEYVVRLADGRTLWVMATAPEAAEGFAELIDRSVGSFRAR